MDRVIVAEQHQFHAHPLHPEPTRAWLLCSTHKPITRAWLRTLRSVGVVVAVRTSDGAEIQLADLMREYR